MGNDASKASGKKGKGKGGAAAAAAAAAGDIKSESEPPPSTASDDVKPEAEAAAVAADEPVEITAALSRNRGGDVQRDVTVEDFDLLKVVGKGSFGKVFLVRKKGGADDNATYAMKSLRKEVLLKRNQIEHTKTERAILESVDHPFIVCLRYAFQSREKLYLVTDFASGGELFFWLKRERVFSQSRARLYAAELVLALEHLHDINIVYRDLKPENILLDAEGHIKLTDFGLSKMAVTGFGAEGGTKTFCGTPEYLAPEILENRGHGKAVDWWSLGTLLYEMMAGLPPFYDTNTEVMYDRILHAELRFPRHFLPETRSLLAGMLTRRVEARLGYRGAGELKGHPFFAGLDWEAVYERRVAPQFVPPANGVEGAGEVTTPGAAGAGAAVVSNFEDEFTRETPVDSVVDRSKLSATAVEKTHFDGFTFVGDAGGGALAASHDDGGSEGGGGGAGGGEEEDGSFTGLSIGGGGGGRERGDSFDADGGGAAGSGSAGTSPLGHGGPLLREAK